MNLNEVNVENEPTRVCLFGSPKSGKTKLTGKLSEYFNLHWFDFEDGYKPLLTLPPDWRARINLYRIPDSRVLPIGIETALKLVKGGKLSLCRKHGKISCALCQKNNAPIDVIDFTTFGPTDIVVWDSGSQIAQSAMAFRTKDEGDDYKPTWDDYGAQGFAMHRFLSQIQVAPWNTVFITHEAEVDLEDKSKKLIPIAGTANFSRNTAKYFDHIIYSRVVNKKHTFASSSVFSAGVLTGSRTDLEIERDVEATLLRAFKPSLFLDADRKEETRRKLEALKGTGK